MLSDESPVRPVYSHKGIMAKKINIVTHRLVPQHDKMSAQEVEQLLETYKLTSTMQLPKISEKDPAIVNLEPKRGDVVRITRKSPTAGTALFYRVVISND